MGNEQALVACAFGWGKEFRLYRETLYVCDTTYRLTDLTGVSLVTRQALGVPSARLELQFGQKTVVLRGIAAVADAGKAAEYLATWCDNQPAERAANSSNSSTSLQALPQTTPTSVFRERATRPFEAPFTLRQRKERFTEMQHGWRRERKTEHVPHEETLPVVSVPVRLAEGEQAHYSAKATHCGERISETLRSTYPAQDHGLLILTNRRMLYIGRKSQMVLEYQHLLHISRLHGALAFEADHWQKRAIFTMPHSEACAACLEAIVQKTSVRQASEVYVR